jgi:hypothetical protein
MKIKLMALIIFTLVPLVSFAETQVSAGLGYQHGGVLGAQLGHVDGVNKYYISLGLVGGAIGYQRVIDSERKQALGIALGSEVLTSEDGFAVLTYNYHFTGLENPGWVIGVSAGVRREDSGGLYSDSGDSLTQGAFMLELGYKF